MYCVIDMLWTIFSSELSISFIYLIYGYTFMIFSQQNESFLL